MNYINQDKNYMSDLEWIHYLESSIRELRNEKEQLKKEKGEIRQRLLKLEKAQAELSRVKENKELIDELRRVTRQRDNLKGIADNLVDENRYLEERLDNKEKVNKQLREELGKFIMKE